MWPRASGTTGPADLPPHGVQHHYAPLGILDTATNTVEPLRQTFVPLTSV